ncbi:MAG: PilN domain-containing protein [Desulfobaccales bacterium]
MIGKASQWWENLGSMLLSETDSLGVYLDKQDLILAHVRKSLTGIQVQQVTRLPSPTGSREDLAAALGGIIPAWGLASCPVSVAVSSELAFFRRATLPLAAAENLAQVVAYELDRFMPLPREELYHGFQVQEETETEIHLMIIALPRSRVSPCLDLLTEATLKPSWLTVAPLAAGNAFALLGSKKMPPSWLLLHLETGSFELTHIHQGSMWSFNHRQRLKGKELTRELVAAIDQAMEGGKAPQGLCVYGDGGADFKVGALQKYEFDITYPTNFVLEKPLPEADREEGLPAVGAALSCLGKLPLEMNLLLPEERAPVKIGRFSTTTILLLVFLGLVLLWSGSALVQKRVALYQVNRQIVRITPEARVVEGLLTESRNLAKQMESMRKIGATPDKLQILRNLTRLIPDNTYLFTLRIHKQNLEISGLSQSASELIPLLEKSGWINKTEFASPIVTDASKLDNFKIKAEIRVLEPTP